MINIINKAIVINFLMYILLALVILIDNYKIKVSDNLTISSKILKNIIYSLILTTIFFFSVILSLQLFILDNVNKILLNFPIPLFVLCNLIVWKKEIKNFKW